MATYIVSSGQTSSGLNLGSSDVLLVHSGGTVDTTTLRTGAVERLLGGAAADTIINGGAIYESNP